MSIKNHPLKIFKNPLLHPPHSNALLGMFIVSASSMIAECCATTGLDWIAVDMEASIASRQDLLHMAQAFNGSAMVFLVRVAENNQQYIEAALDTGVHGIIVPKVSTQHDAERAVKASYYSPIGKRGLNPIRCSAYFDSVSSYIEKASTISCFVQIETQKAIENLDTIASVKGVSGLFIGLGDLTMDYGLLADFENPVIQDAIMLVLSTCKKYDLIPGIFAYSNELARRYVQLGFKLIGMGNEIKFLRQAIDSNLSDIKKS